MSFCDDGDECSVSMGLNSGKRPNIREVVTLNPSQGFPTVNENVCGFPQLLQAKDKPAPSNTQHPPLSLVTSHLQSTHCI
jgi:hypothetical protein